MIDATAPEFFSEKEDERNTRYTELCVQYEKLE